MRRLIIVGLVAGLFLLGACGWHTARNEDADDASVDGPVSAVRLASDSGNVTLRPGSRTTVHRSVHWDRERPGQTFRVEGDVLVIDPCPVRNCWVDYEITVPAGTRVDGSVDSGTVAVDGLAAVNLKVDSGDVTLRGITGAVNLDTDSGTAQLSDIGSSVVVRSDSGDVTVDNPRAAVTVAASSGHVLVRGAGGAADLRSDSGDVAVELAAAQDVRAQADSGDVTVTVPRTAYRLSTATGSGDVDSAVTDDPAAGHRLDLHTDSGDITIRYA